MANAYDYIVVGSGSSGGVIAARLSESGKHSVLCLEAGTEDENYIWTRSPLGGAFMIHDPKVNWNEFSEPNESTGNRSIHVPHGKILGGSSAINATIANRGQAADYDHWAQLGCRGWSFSDILPYFKAVETTNIGTEDLRGRAGPIKITKSSKLSPFYDLFIASAQAAGIPPNPDYLGSRQFGSAMAQLAAHRGKRHSTASQYLAPARRRKNLTITTGALATRLLFEGTKCIGVEIEKNGRTFNVRANREVIVSCGAINSPKLLELSGIGDPEILGEFGLPVVQALSGVGNNLRDHFGPTLRWTLNTPGISISDQGRGWRLFRELLRYVVLGKGFMSQGLGTMRIFARSRPDLPDSDIQMMANPFLVEVGGGAGISGTHGKRSMSRVNGFYMSVQVQRPESSGSVHIRSVDATKTPAIRYNFLATEHDRYLATAGVRLAREIVSCEPLGPFIGAELAPGPKLQSDDDLISYTRNTGSTTYHPVGTCKMGHDSRAVVDDRLRVHGVAGLRVADASIMPMIISGNTGIPCMAIGEKAAAMILEDVAAG
ncbi:FAD-binding protein [Mesorhizobium sp. M00.F.Ca.ET.149.01.1.1]|nr:FAD-binding protein [Mesorhizobium sp. M8A.F.Ca.ET.197.01.1.1]TGR39274.1 FAD-binding protein [bacterium M00.F.Ca.ET.199.01.1.1]TGR46871.1 FAD-binding protein [Mesorhizobium sp. M8A.F.Ca.ET.198.01.1.1]TGV85329.1 FAD-binding protein [Mesorhizobium sp. M00.F.Ca.ET.149.01.1.1]